MKYGRVKKESSRLITVWIPLDELPLLDMAVHREDSDRSKYIRQAIREKMAGSASIVSASARGAQ